MIYNYKRCSKKYKNRYEINKKIEGGILRKIGRNLYTDSLDDSELFLISSKYPNAVFTLRSAFYYQGLTDTIPDYYYLLTDKDSSKIQDDSVKQYFDNSNSLSLGKETKIYNGTKIKVFNKERLLVELIRNKNKLSFDYYKEIILNYRKIISELDISLIEKYASKLPKSKLVLRTISLEIL